MADIDSLDIKIQADSKGAADAIEDLNKKLGIIIESLTAFGKIPGISALNEQTKNITANVSAAGEKIKTVTKQIEPQVQKVSRTMGEVAERFKDIGKGFRISGGSTASIQKQIDSYKNALENAKVKEQELSAKGKTDTKGYEDAVADIQKYSNMIESLTAQLQEMQSTAQGLDDINIHLMSDDNKQTLEELQSSLERFRESLQSDAEYKPFAAIQYGLEELRERFPEAAEWAKAFEDSISQIDGERPFENTWDGADVPPELQSEAEAVGASIQSAKEKMAEFRNALEQLEVPEIREGNLSKLYSGLEKAEEKVEQLRVKLENGLTMGKITESADDTGFRNIQEQITIAEKTAEAFKAKISEVSAETGRSAKEAAEAFRNKLANLRIPEIQADSLEQLGRQLQITEVELDRLKAKLQNDLTMGRVTADFGDTGFQKQIEQITFLEQQSEALQKKIAQVSRQSGEAEGISRFSAALSSLSAAGEKAKTALSRFASVVKKIGSAFGSALSKVGGFTKSMFSLKKSSDGTHKSFSLGFGKLLKYGLGLESIMAAMNRLRGAFKDGMNNLVQYSEETNKAMSSMKSSLDALKNSLAVAFAPIVNVVAPYISAFIDMLTRAFNVIGQFFAALTGHSFAIQAKKNFSDYAAGVSKAGSAAKKAGKDVKSGIRSLDELKTITSQDSSGDGGGAGGIIPEDMFETVPVESQISDMAAEAGKVLSNIFGVFRQAWEAKGKAVIDSAKAALGSLADVAASVGTAFYEVFTGGAGLIWVESSLESLRSMLDVVNSISAAFSDAWNSGSGVENVTALFNMLTNVNGLLTSVRDSFSNAFSSGIGTKIFENIIGIATGLYDTISNIAVRIQEAWDKAGLGESIWNGILSIVNTIPETIHNITDATAVWAESLDFAPLLESVDTLLQALQPFTENIGAGLEWFWNNVLLPIAGWAVGEAVPTFLNLLASATGMLNSVLEVLQPLGTWLWESFLQPLGEWTGETIILAIESLTNGFGMISGALQGSIGNAEGLTGVLNETLAPVVSLFTETLIPGLAGAWNTLSDTLSPFGEFISGIFSSAWSDILTPALGFLSQDALPEVTGAFQNLWDNVLAPLGEFIASVLNPIIEILSGVFTTLWQTVVVPLAQFIGGTFAKAFQGIAQIFNHTAVPAVNGVIRVFQFLWNSVFRPIVNFLRSTFKPIFESVFAAIGGIIKNLQKVFGGLIDFIAGVFTGNWRQAWDGIVQIFDGMFGAVKNIINGILGAVEGMANGIINGINAGIRALNTISFSIPNWVPGLGGKSFGFNIGLLGNISIPRLEKGGITLRHTFAEIGEYNKPEAVLPLTNARTMGMIADSIYENYNGNTVDSGFSSDVIERAVYTATYNAVSAAIGNSKLLNDQKDMVEGILKKPTIGRDTIVDNVRSWYGEEAARRYGHRGACDPILG